MNTVVKSKPKRKYLLKRHSASLKSIDRLCFCIVMYVDLIKLLANIHKPFGLLIFHRLRKQKQSLSTICRSIKLTMTRGVTALPCNYTKHQHRSHRTNYGYETESQREGRINWVCRGTNVKLAQEASPLTGPEGNFPFPNVGRRINWPSSIYTGEKPDSDGYTSNSG